MNQLPISYRPARVVLQSPPAPASRGLSVLPCTGSTRSERGTTLIDVLFAILGTTFLFVTVYLGFTQGFGVIQLARENLRATQVLQEKLETVWLYNWSQITNKTFIPSTFEAPFYPVGVQSGQGFIYKGTVSIEPAPLSESYAADMRLVTVNVSWKSGEANRVREMQTLVSRYGMHNYIYYKN